MGRDVRRAGAVALEELKTAFIAALSEPETSPLLRHRKNTGSGWQTSQILNLLASFIIGRFVESITAKEGPRLPHVKKGTV